jgi:hypothetical protein
MVFSSMRLFRFYAPLLFSFALSMQYKRFDHYFGRGSSRIKKLHTVYSIQFCLTRDATARSTDEAATAPWDLARSSAILDMAEKIECRNSAKLRISRKKAAAYNRW